MIVVDVFVLKGNFDQKVTSSLSWWKYEKLGTPQDWTIIKAPYDLLSTKSHGILSSPTLIGVSVESNITYQFFHSWNSLSCLSQILFSVDLFYVSLPRFSYSIQSLYAGAIQLMVHQFIIDTFPAPPFSLNKAFWWLHFIIYTYEILLHIYVILFIPI